MGYTIFTVGERVRVHSGSFAGIEGTVVAPTASHEGGTVVVQGASMLLPVSVVTIIDGHEVTLRVPPDILERVEAE